MFVRYCKQIKKKFMIINCYINGYEHMQISSALIIKGNIHIDLICHGYSFNNDVIYINKTLYTYETGIIYNRNKNYNNRLYVKAEQNKYIEYRNGYDSIYYIYGNLLRFKNKHICIEYNIDETIKSITYIK